MSTKAGLILALCLWIGPCVIMWLLSALNLIAMPNGWIAVGVAAASTISSLIVAKKTGNLG